MVDAGALKGKLLVAVAAALLVAEAREDARAGDGGSESSNEWSNRGDTCGKDDDVCFEAVWERRFDQK